MADSTAHQPSDTTNAVPSMAPVSAIASVEAVLADVTRTAPQVLSEMMADPVSMQPEIESLLRDIGALGDQVRAAVTPTAPPQSSLDVDALHADIERAIAEAQVIPKVEVSIAVPIAVPIAAKQPAPPPRVDPLLQEIDAALADDADSLVARAGGDVRAALASVFDEGALAGLDEEINRALIEAFGTSKLDNPTFRAEPTPRITNPAAKFGGIAKQIPAGTDFEFVAAAPTGEMTEEALLPAPALYTEPVVVATITTETEPTASVSTPVAATNHAPQPTVVVDHPAEVPQVGVVAEVATRVTTPSKWRAMLVRVAQFPARFLMHETVHQVLAALAVATLLAVPIAWYSAWQQSQAPAVGRVAEEVLPAAATEGAEKHEAEAKPAEAPAAAHH